MSNALLAFLIAISAGTWIFSRMMRRSGGITQNALIVAAIAGVFIFFLVWMLAGMIA